MVIGMTVETESRTDDDYIVLLNALKFKGIWEDRFEKTKTKKKISSTSPSLQSG